MDKKTLRGKKAFAMLTADGTLIRAHKKRKNGHRKFSGTFSDGTQVNSPIITMDETGNILSVMPAKGKTLSGADLKLATEISDVYGRKLKATQINL